MFSTARTRTRLIAALGTVVLAAGCGRPRSSARVFPKAPVVLISIDTLRSDRLPFYGYAGVKTPALSALRDDSILFESAWSHAPLTLPSHATVFTGLLPAQNGLHDNLGYSLNPSVPTIAELLGKAGYATGGAVTSIVLSGTTGIGRGFGLWDDDVVPTRAFQALSRVQRSGDEAEASMERWIEKQSGPFLAFLHLYEPHAPYEPKEPFRSLYASPYDGEIATVDAITGKFLDFLKAKGLYDRSLIVLMSDHGEGLGDHGETFHGFLVYDTTIHAALIVRPPGGVRGGRVVDRTVSHVDLLPTILDLVGLKAPENVHGRSLAPLVAGRDVPWDRPVYSESLYPLLHYGWAPLRALRAGRFKLIDVPRPELYDVAQDPTEEQNLHSVDPNRARELTADLGRLRHRIESGKLPAGNAPEIDQRAVARLRSLGYLAGGGGVAVGKESERVRADPKDRLQLHQKIVDAQSRISHREYDAAGRLLEQVLAEDAEIVDAHQMLGQIAAERRRPRDAIRHFKRALELNPMHEQSLFDLAAEYADLGRWDEALAGFRRVLELKGADARASLAIADVYVRLKRFDEAADVLDKASQSGESAPFFANKMGEVRVEQGRDDEAVPQFERAVALDDGFALPHFNLGFLREKRGEGRLAAEQYARALELEPAFFRAQFNLGRLHAAMGDVERARQSWEAFLRSNPGSVQGRYYFAKLLMDTGGDLVRAENLAREGIALDPGHAEGPLGYYVLADLLNRRGRAAEARAAAATGRRIEEAVKR